MTAPQLAPGTVVAQKYRLAALIGYSGSAATYQATGSDGRDVVLKLFDPAMRQRADIMSAIEQTYAATNALPQDVAAPLLDAGYDAATGAPFSVGERIAFPSLTQLVAQRPMPADDVARVIGALATLLDQAHARGLFHHALKPANVFVGFAQGQGIRVTDFGAGLPRAAVPSQEGYVVAAPWLAPEQVLASAPPAGAADVFSVGLIAFFALTGRSYWRSCQGAVDLNGWQQELGAPRTPPSARARELGAVLNSAFDGVLGCALSVDPGQRYRSVRELAQALEGLVAARAPESQATQAFNPASLGLGPGGYPPPPQPPGGGYPPQPAGYAAAPGAPGGPVLPAQAYPTLQNGYGAPQPAPSAPGPWGGGQVAQQAPAGNNANGQQAYVATQTPPVNTQNPQLEETAAGRVLMAQAAAPRPATNRFAPILVGVVALLLLAGGAGAWVVMGKRAHADATTDATSATPTATASPSASAPAEAPTTSAPADTASAAPRDSASALPADTTPPAASGQAAAGSAPVDSTLACDPDCDEIRVDDKPIELGKPVDLPAGKHVIVATKSGFLSARETIVVTAGEKVERTFKLKPLPTGPAPTPAISAPTKPCGKFLKRAGCK